MEDMVRIGSKAATGDDDVLQLPVMDVSRLSLKNYGPAKTIPMAKSSPALEPTIPDQPIEADDVLIGGAGADTFYFRTLINAKRDIILKHVNDDGTIEWGNARSRRRERR